MKLLSWLQAVKDAPLESTEKGQPLAPLLQARLSSLEGMKVKECMIPRSIIMGLDADVQLRRVKRLKSSKSLFFPVYKGDFDQILGWISKNKVLELLNAPAEDINFVDYIRPVGRIDEEASVAEMADAFLESGSPFLVVQNTEGQTVGLMLLSEWVELIFGFELTQTASPANSETPAPLLRSYEL